MVFDELQNASMYYGFSDRMKVALQYLQETDLTGLAVGKYDIDGDDVFVMIQEYDSKAKDEGAWEAHKQYLDVQYIISGEEQMGLANTGTLQASEYDEENDFMTLVGDGEFLKMAAGSFMILAPQDAHMPGIATDGSQPVKKAVVKVRI